MDNNALAAADNLATTDGQHIALDDHNNPPAKIELLPLGDIALRQRGRPSGGGIG